MGLNPTILRQVRAFALAVSPSEPPAVPRRCYRASGLVLTSTPAVRSALIAVIPRQCGEEGPASLQAVAPRLPGHVSRCSLSLGNAHEGTVKANKYRRFFASNPAERGG